MSVGAYLWSPELSGFRWLILAVLLSAVSVSAYHRARARRSGETIARRREGPLFVTVRGLMALTLFGAIVLHVVRPEWMRWASLEVPAGVRWVGVALGLLTVPLVHWVLRTLGPNVSETVLTKERHELVTSGPYRWVRHPLYSTGLALFVALGVMAGSWLVLLASVIAALLLRWLVIPREEQALLARFGDRYREYRQTTGRLLPRMRGGTAPWRLTVLVVCVVAGLALALIHVCADGGAMAAAYRTCDCRGIEWQLYDRTAADGPRRTLCFGWVQARTCYQFRGGPTVSCGT